MSMNRRLTKIEKQFKANEKYKGCELEIQVGVDDEPTRFFCLHPDGRKELITDPGIIQQLEDIPGDEITVEIVD